jgi:hypothetical protein
MRCLWVFCAAEDGEVCRDVVVNEVYDSAVWRVSYDITFMIDVMVRIPVVPLMGMTGMNTADGLMDGYLLVLLFESDDGFVPQARWGRIM